ncbi:hypothetical protein D3C78_1195420 [compost metagenome]
MILLVEQSGGEMTVEDDDINLITSVAVTVDHQTCCDLIAIRQIGPEHSNPVVLDDCTVRSSVRDGLSCALQLESQFRLDIHKSFLHPGGIGDAILFRSHGYSLARHG